MQNSDLDNMRVALDRRFEVEAAIRAYRNLGYSGDRLLSEMGYMFSFDPEQARSILNAAPHEA